MTTIPVIKHEQTTSEDNSLKTTTKEVSIKNKFDVDTVLTRILHTYTFTHKKLTTRPSTTSTRFSVSTFPPFTKQTTNNRISSLITKLIYPSYTTSKTVTTTRFGN